jgi:hypothetical protein
MATWINVRKAAKFPEVIRVYKRAGRSQGSGQAVPSYGAGLLQSAPKGFLRTIQIFFQGESVQNASVPTLPAWLRKKPLSNSNDWQDCQVDVTAIPGVRPLRDNGKWTGFVA